MKKILLSVCAFLVSIHTYAQNLPSKAQIIERMKFVNNYFLSSQGTNMGGNMWARSVYYTGNMACYYTTQDANYLEQSFRWAETYNWQLYENRTLTRDADMQCCSQTYLELYKINPTRANITNVKTCIDNMMSTNIIDDWSFVDRMYMAMPIFALMGDITGNNSYHDRMFAMFSNTKDTRKLFEDTTGLWWRDPGVKPPHLTPNGKHEHWSRGNGWSIGAVTRVLKILPANSPYRQAYADVLRKMAAGLKKVQRPDGFWNVSLEDPNEFPGPETSGTVFFIYGIAYGINEGILDRATYLPVVERAYQAILNTAIQPDGRLGYCQGPGVRPSDAQPVTNRSTTDYAVGAFLLASAEIYKLTGSNCNAGVITRATITPISTSIQLNRSVAFSASAFDGCSQPISSTPIWSCTGGTITASGIYTPTSTGNQLVRVQYGSISATSNIVVTDGVLSSNIALRKSVVVSGEQTGNLGLNINDGNLTNRWSAEQMPKEAIIDLGADFRIEQIKVYPYLNRSYQYRIDIRSSSGTNYLTIVDRTANTESASELSNNVAATGRYIRLTVIGAGNYTGPWVSIREIEVYGKPISSAVREVDEVQLENNGISIFPNPTQEFLFVTGVKSGSKISILSIDGYTLIETVETQINISELPVGVYHVMADEQTIKFMKK